MNRNNENEQRSRKNHYSDFDEHGNMRGGSNNRRDDRSDDISMRRDFNRYADRNRSDYRAHDNQDNRNGGNYEHPRFGARAYGDMSGGTPYGEGGSTYGGGSAYGRSNYGMSGEHGPDYRSSDRNQSENVRNGYGDFTDYNSRNYGTFGGSNYRGNMDDDRSYSRNSRSDRDNTGYNRSFSEFGNTGYGSTSYNNRDLDRERGVQTDRTFRNADRFNEQEHGKYYNTRGRGNDSFNRNYEDRDRDY